MTINSMTNQNHHHDDDFNIIIMSDGGKPLFHSRFDNQEERISTLCSFIQALRATSKDPSLNCGDIQSIQTNNSIICFLNAGCFTIIIISQNSNNTTIYLQLLLEYFYGKVIFTLTNHVQYMMENDGYYDISSVFEGIDQSLRDMIDYTVKEKGMMLIPGVEVFSPVSFHLRNNVSKVLAASCHDTKEIIFAILMVESKIFTIIQPNTPNNQLHSSDVTILVQFLTSPTIESNQDELWLPICLPRLNEHGFVFAFHSKMNLDSKITLTLVSQDSSTEHFSLLRGISFRIRTELGLMNHEENILRVYDQSNEIVSNNNTNNDVSWERQIHNNVSVDRYIDSDFQRQSKYKSKSPSYNILETIHSVLSSNSRQSLLQSYCQNGEVIHFAFRFLAEIRHFKTGKNSGGTLSQYLGSETNFLNDIDVWEMYQKLSLRLRVGSASTEVSMDAIENITLQSNNHDDNSNRSTQFCSVQQLFESTPSFDGVTYLQQYNDYMFLGMNGENFELYVTLPGGMQPTSAVTVCTKLIRALMNDKDELFISRPLSF